MGEEATRVQNNYRNQIKTRTVTKTPSSTKLQ
jgi:hypothetical protein